MMQLGCHTSVLPRCGIKVDHQQMPLPAVQHSRRVTSNRHSLCADAAQPGISESYVAQQALRELRPCIMHDLHSQQVAYEQAWQWQKDEVALMADQLGSLSSSNSDGQQILDRAIILQHPPVYTLGTGSTQDNLLFQQRQSSHPQDSQQGSYQIPVIRTERGGEVTYHGPGQLVLYPLLHLAHHKQDLHWYMRSLEEVIIIALREVSGLKGERVPGLTGVWVEGAKVAAIGVRAKRWITYHGVALNVCNDLGPFQRIIPCGISDKPVTSVQRLLEGKPGVLSDNDSSSNTPVQLAPRAQFTDAETLLLDEYSYAIQEAFSEVFNLELEVVDSIC